MAESLGLGAALWSPLGGGLLTGKYRESDAGRLTDWQRVVHTEDSAHKTAVVDAVLAIAAEIGVPPAHVAMAWMRGRAARAATHELVAARRDTLQGGDVSRIIRPAVPAG